MSNRTSLLAQLIVDKYAHHLPVNRSLSKCFCKVDGAIALVPALPDEWAEGFVKGLLARGGFQIDMNWNAGKMATLTLYAKKGGSCRIRSAIPLKLGINS